MSRSSAELRLPADSAYVAAVRLTTAAFAARLGFSIDDLEDARIAVSEACTLLLDQAGAPASDPAMEMLEIRYELEDRRLGVDISAPTGSEIDRASFGWQLLTAMTTDLTTEVADGRRHISYLSESATRSE